MDTDPLDDADPTFEEAWLDDVLAELTDDELASDELVEFVEA